MTEYGGKNAVGIARVDGERRNLLSVHEAKVGPGLAGVGGLVDAVAHGEVGAMQALAAADINDVGI